MTPGVPSPPTAPDGQTAVKRAAKKLRLPLVSGRTSVILLVVCFVVAAAIMWLVGRAMELPHWVRVELALAAWWVVWSAALAHFLYYGRRISDDHVYQGPRDWLATFRRPKTPAGSGAAGSSWGEVGSWTVPEGCALAIGVVLVAVLVFFLTWLLIEVVFPVLAIMLYGLIRGMLAKVANDQHGCNGRFGAAFLWGSIWATVYTAPLALLVWVVHMIVQYRAAG